MSDVSPRTASFEYRLFAGLTIWSTTTEFKQGSLARVEVCDTRAEVLSYARFTMNVLGRNFVTNAH